MVKKLFTKHGDYLLPEYKVWSAMIQRCTNPRNKKYPRYGGRGIRVCERWSNYENFKMDMGKRPFGRMTIERIDTNGDYTPENCVWETYSVQNRNTSQNRFIEIDGIKLCVSDWSKISGIPNSTIRYRLSVGKDSKQSVFSQSCYRK